MDKDIKFALIVMSTLVLSVLTAAWYDMGMTHELERQKIELLAKGCGHE